MEPSGISRVFTTLQTVPNLYRSCSPGSSTLTSVCGTAPRRPSFDSTSRTSLTDLVLPMVTGNTVPGKITALRSARMGIASGSVDSSTLISPSPITGIIFTSIEVGESIFLLFFILIEKVHGSALLPKWQKTPLINPWALYGQSLCQRPNVAKKAAKVLKIKKNSLNLHSVLRRVHTNSHNYTKKLMYYD